MSYETIQLVAGGNVFEGWTEATVTAAINTAVRAFQVQVTEIGPWDGAPPPYNFPPFTPIQVCASGDLLIAGYVDAYNPSGDASSHNVMIEGRGLGADYVDCSCDHSTGRFEGKSVLQIAQELDKFGVGVTALASAAEAAAEVIPWFMIRRGSTPWAEMMRLLPQRGLTMMGLADGTIAIARAAVERHAGGLIQGRNILQMSARISGAERFSETRVIGQSPLGVEKQPSFEPEGIAFDKGVPRFRMKEIVAAANTDPSLVQAQADWDSARATGRSATAQITVPSFRDEAGRLWQPSWRVHITAPWLKLDQDMVIENVTFHQDDSSGTTATLSLVSPPTLFGQAPGASGSDGMWGVGGSVGDAVRFFGG